MGLPAEENFAFCLEGLIDYAIFGETLSGHGLIIGCESQTSSKAYNLFRGESNKVPMFFVTGKGIDSGVNIL